jgi:hypothetical protein
VVVFMVPPPMSPCVDTIAVQGYSAPMLRFPLLSVAMPTRHKTLRCHAYTAQDLTLPPPIHAVPRAALPAPCLPGLCLLSASVTPLCRRLDLLSAALPVPCLTRPNPAFPCHAAADPRRSLPLRSPAPCRCDARRCFPKPLRCASYPRRASTSPYASTRRPCRLSRPLPLRCRSCTAAPYPAAA